MGRTVLITGATGNVSRALLDTLEDSDLDLRALIRDESKAASLEARGVEVFVGSLDDSSSCRTCSARPTASRQTEPSL